MTNPKELTGPQEAAIAVLADGGTNEQAAVAAHCDVSTLRRWRQLPLFRAALRQRRIETPLVTMSDRRALALDAVRTIRAVLNDERAPATARVAASKAAFEILQQARENDDADDNRAEFDKMNAEHFST